MGKKPPFLASSVQKRQPQPRNLGFCQMLRLVWLPTHHGVASRKVRKEVIIKKMSRSNCLAIAFGCSCFFFVQELAGLHASLQRQCDPEPHFTGNVRSRRNRHALQKSNTSHSHTKHKSAGLAGVSNRVWLGDARLVCSVIWLVWPKLELIYRLLDGFLVRLGTTPCSEGSWARFFRGAAGFGGASDNC